MNPLTLLRVVTLPCWLASAFAAEPTTVFAEKYYRTFSAAHPVLKRIKPGELIATKTIDSTLPIDPEPVSRPSRKRIDQVMCKSRTPIGRQRSRSRESS